MIRPLVIHVVTSLAQGGLERIVVTLVNEGNRRFAGTTSVCCLDGRGDLAGEVADNFVSCIDARRDVFPWDAGAVGRLRALISNQLSRCSSVVVHAHNMAAWQYAVLAARGTAAKVVYTQHGANIHNRGFKNRFRSVLLSWFTHSIVAVSESTAEAMIQCQGITRRRIKVIRNGVDVSKFIESKNRGEGETESGSAESAICNLKSQIGIPSNSPVIGSVGRLDYVKGYDRLISAFAALVSRRESPSLRLSDSPVLLLVGDGPERKKLEVRAKALGINGRVIFAGYQNDVAAYLGLMDLFVLPSRSEGLPVALLEALAAGIPVAATEAGGSREVLDAGRIGAILPENETLWPDVIGVELGAGKDARDERIRMGRAWVDERYSFKSMFEAYERIYE